MSKAEYGKKSNQKFDPPTVAATRGSRTCNENLKPRGFALAKFQPI